jgi:hypothetical protein
MRIQLLLFTIIFCYTLQSQAFVEKLNIQNKSILVQVENEDILKEIYEISLKKNWNLLKKDYFVQLKIFLFSINKNLKPSNICIKIKEINGVKDCTVDSKLIFQDKEVLQCNSADFPTQDFSVLVDIKSKLEECEIFRTGPIPPFHVEDGRLRPTGLSPYWAQEYVGADLTRQKLSEFTLNKKIPENLVEVWDSSSGDHGSKVSNLIAGPHESAVVPVKKTISYKDLHNQSDYARNYESFYENCLKSKKCPAYINNSMMWDSSVIRDVAENLARDGSVIITAAGNGNETLEPNKQSVIKSKSAIVVSSLSPSGRASKFTNYSQGMTISAPADLTAFSYDKDGKPIAFGGTSAATPIVTGALAAFTTLTGYRLDSQEATRLLELTAIPFPHYPLSNGLGSGILNSYKITEVALKLNKLCNTGDKDKCIKQKLIKANTFQFPPHTDNSLRKFDQAFPECIPGGDSRVSSFSCLDKKQLVTELRKAAFLNPDTRELWKRLSCIYKGENFIANANFYEALSERSSDDSVITKALYLEQRENFYKYLFPSLDVLQNKKWINELIKKSDYKDDIVKKVLTTSRIHSSEGRKFLIEIIDSSCCASELAQWIVSQDFWKKDQRLIDKLVEKGTVDKELARYILPSHNINLQVVDKLIDKGTADKEIVQYILPYFSFNSETRLIEEELLSKLISKRVYNRNIAANMRGSLSSKMINKVLENSDADDIDGSIIAFQLKFNAKLENIEILKSIILRGKSDEEIEEHILKNKDWKNLLAKKFNLATREVSLDKLKILLVSN